MVLIPSVSQSRSRSPQLSYPALISINRADLRSLLTDTPPATDSPSPIHELDVRTSHLSNSTIRGYRKLLHIGFHPTSLISPPSLVSPAQTKLGDEVKA
ncbi:hypothetical protein P3342_003685 [Pyrenophora teres f. teres]|nr:hypothetical protein P3342_003685 [Pyrenophora teres f. teres]